MSRDKESVRKALSALVSTNSDSTIIDYLVGILEDEQFEFGEDASVAYDALGDFLVRLGCNTRTTAVAIATEQTMGNTRYDAKIIIDFPHEHRSLHRDSLHALI